MRHGDRTHLLDAGGRVIARSAFLAVAAAIACAVGAVALITPTVLLDAKGVTDGAAAVWMREVGALLLAVGCLAFAVRHHAPSPTLRAVLWTNAALQLALLPIEPLAYHAGVITRLAGIAPNTVVHVLLAAGFAWHARRAY